MDASRASLPTIKTLIASGASIVIAAHLGRPKGEAKPELSLAPVAKRLSELLGAPVQFAGAVTGSDVTAKAAALKAGEILLLENIRFAAAETSKDEAERQVLAKELAVLADAYVGDGFGRYTASMLRSLIFQSYFLILQEPLLLLKLKFLRS